MATEPTPLPVNGNYGTQQTQHYGGAEQPPSTQNHTGASNGPSSFGAQGANVPSSAGSTSTSGGNEGNSGIPKDEVGWYFVEQYYTTLSRNPEKLHVSKAFPLIHRTGNINGHWNLIDRTEADDQLALLLEEIPIRLRR